MSTDIAMKAVQHAKTVKSLLGIGERLRDLATQNSNAAPVAGQVVSPLADLLSQVPDSITWRIYDHCATLTRLYSIYEEFIGDVVRSWLGELPTHSSVYGSLVDSFRTEHRKGVAKVLGDLDKDRFSHLDPPSVVRQFLEALDGANPYSLLPEAFLHDGRSLKRERLDQLFALIMLEGGWQWVAQHRYVSDYFAQVRGGENTADSELRTFIQYRNDAAHGNVDEVLGTSTLSQYADFVMSVCLAIDELRLWNSVRRKVGQGVARKIGNVTERFSNKRVIIAKIRDAEVAVGHKLVLFGENYCYEASVESIQLDDVDHQAITVTAETEVGIRLNKESRKHPVLYRM